MEKIRVYVDLDDTLVDFTGAFKKLSDGISPNDYEKKYGINSFFETILNPAGAKHWAELKWLPFGRALYSFLIERKEYIDLYILSTPSRATSSIIGKTMWIMMNIKSDDIPINNIILDRKKEQYCTKPGCVLIDDRERNIEKWAEVGGVALRFENNIVNLREICTKIDKLIEEKKNEN